MTKESESKERKPGKKMQGREEESCQQRMEVEGFAAQERKYWQMARDSSLKLFLSSSLILWLL